MLSVVLLIIIPFLDHKYLEFIVSLIFEGVAFNVTVFPAHEGVFVKVILGGGTPITRIVSLFWQPNVFTTVTVYVFVSNGMMLAVAVIESLFPTKGTAFSFHE